MNAPYPSARPASIPLLQPGETPPSLELVTSEGVTVLVHDHPAPAPIWEAPRAPPTPPPPPPGPQVVIVPMHQADEARDAYIAQLDGEWGQYIQSQLARRRDIAYESARELRQDVLLLVREHHRKEEAAGRPGAPENIKAFLSAVIDNVARNHVRMKGRRPQTEDGADVDEQLDLTTDPERAAMVAEARARLVTYRDELTPEELEVYEGRILGLKLEVIGVALGKSKSRVAELHAGAVKKLRALAEGAPPPRATSVPTAGEDPAILRPVPARRDAPCRFRK